MKKDITAIFKDWAFDPRDICARKITGLDGRTKLQVRLDIGLLQMEINGRPDGTRPHGQESVLAYYLDKLKGYRDENGSEEGFFLNEEAGSELGQEGLLYYHRYICLLRLGDYEAVVRDTSHSLAIFDLLKSFVQAEEDKLSFEQYRPYVIMINTRARGEIFLQRNDYDSALEVVKEGIGAIRSFFEVFEEPELTESNEELQALESWAEEISRGRPMSKKQWLTQQMQEAIAEEAYEKAAQLRDRLWTLGDTHS